PGGTPSSAARVASATIASRLASIAWSRTLPPTSRRCASRRTPAHVPSSRRKASPRSTVRSRSAVAPPLAPCSSSCPRSLPGPRTGHGDEVLADDLPAERVDPARPRRRSAARGAPPEEALERRSLGGGLAERDQGAQGGKGGEQPVGVEVAVRSERKVDRVVE